MNKRVSFIFYMCLLLGLNLSVSCKSNRSTSTAESDVVQQLEIDKPHYFLGENVIVQIYLQNNTKEKLVICDRPKEKVNFFTHCDGMEKSLKKDPVIFEKPTSKESFVMIKPKTQVFYGTMEFDEEYFDKVGKWELYTASGYGFSGKDLGLNAWQGTVRSNVLTVHIKDNEDGKESK